MYRATSCQDHKMMAAKRKDEPYSARTLQYMNSYHQVKKSGFLVRSPARLDNRGKWKKRWCMLVDLVEPTKSPERKVRLDFYKKEHSAEGQLIFEESLDLCSCIAVVTHDKKLKGHNYVLSIVKPNLEIHHLAATSKAEREEWMTSMNEFIFDKSTCQNETSPTEDEYDYVDNELDKRSILSRTRAIALDSSSDSESDKEYWHESMYEKKDDKTEELEYGSENEYWNDPIPPREYILLPKTKKNTETNESNCRQFDVSNDDSLSPASQPRSLKVMLPQVDLVRRWSMSSQEESSEEESDQKVSVLPQPRNFNSSISPLSISELSAHTYYNVRKNFRSSESLETSRSYEDHAYYNLVGSYLHLTEGFSKTRTKSLSKLPTISYTDSDTKPGKKPVPIARKLRSVSPEVTVVNDALDREIDLPKKLIPNTSSEKVFKPTPLRRSGRKSKSSSEQSSPLNHTSNHLIKALSLPTKDNLRPFPLVRSSSNKEPTKSLLLSKPSERPVTSPKPTPRSPR